MNKKSLVKTILWTGLLTGTLDILAAFIMYVTSTGKNPVNVLLFIASGIFGTAAFSGDTVMALWGLIFHFSIAFSFTIFFFLLYPKVKMLAKNKILAGILYGLFIWLVMNLIVVPLSNTPKFPFNLMSAVKGIIVLMLMIGLPLSIIASRFYSKSDPIR